MNKKIVAIIIGVVLVLIIVALFVFQSPEAPAPEDAGGNGVFPESSSLPEGTSGFGLPNLPGGESGTTSASVDIESRFHKITNAPVAGYVALGSNEDLNLNLRYAEKETGHIFDYKAGGTVAERVTNTTIPRVQDVLWDKTGGKAIFRYFDGDENTVKTFVASLVSSVSTSSGATTTETKLDGVFLPDNITSLGYSTNTRIKNPIFYLTTSGSGATGYLTDFSGGKLTPIFNSSFSDWDVMWPNKLYLFTKPSGLMEGFVYTLNENLSSATETSVEKVLGGRLGLSPLPNKTGSLMLFSESKGATPELSLYKVAQKEISSLPLKTFAEKCAWGEKNEKIFYCAVPLSFPGGIYPDDWYKGKSQTSDGFVSYNIETGFFQILAIMERDLGERVDVTDLVVAADDSVLFFKNKLDQSLWSFSIK